jgi:putative inorganic carbon (HCO3(-)) transporter
MNGIKSMASRLASLEIYMVVLAVGASMVLTRLLAVALGVTAFFALARCLSQRRLSLRTPADVGILLLLLTVPVTLLITVKPEVTLPQVYRLLLGIGLFCAILNWGTNKPRLKWLAAGLVLAALGLALFATVSVQWVLTKIPLIPASLYERFVTLVGDTVHHNVMAGNLVILLPLSLALILFAWRELPRWAGISAALISMVVLGMLVLTQSRGGLIALGVVLVVLLVLRFRFGWLAIPIAGVGAGLLIHYLGIEPVFDTLSSGVSLGGFEGRVEIWSRAIYMTQDFPFTGIGMGLFGEVADLLYPFFLAAPGSIPHAHNLLLQIAVDLGIPGLIAWLAIFLTLTVSAWQVFRSSRIAGDGWFMGLSAGLLCSQLALIAHGLVDAVTWGMVRPAPLVWALWGMIAALANLQSKDKLKEDTGMF